MPPAPRVLRRALATMAALGVPLVVSAQSTPAPARSSLADTIRSSTTPRAGDSYIGIGVGQSHFATSCGEIAGLSCSDNGTAYTVTAGTLFTDNVGAALSWVDLGKADRAGGTVSARGVNLSVLGQVPVGQSVSVFGKVGGTYGITNVDVPVESGLDSGRETGLGFAYGAGVDIHVARGLHGNVGWEQHALRFRNDGMSKVGNVTVGLGYAF